MTLTENSAALASPFPSSFETRTLYKGHVNLSVKEKLDYNVSQQTRKKGNTLQQLGSQGKP